jgi:hypothetical protein
VRFIIISAAALLLLIPNAVSAKDAKAPAASSAQKAKMASPAKKKTPKKKPAEQVQYLRSGMGN